LLKQTETYISMHMLARPHTVSPIETSENWCDEPCQW